jgi:type III pantothenate kinase
MILAVDVGNTETHVGLFSGGALIRDWRLGTRPVRTSDEQVLAMAELLRDAAIERGEVGGMVLASVVPRATSSLEEMARQWLRLDPLTVGPDIRLPITICTRDPGQVGADRIANAVAACDWHEPPVIVVDLGTATTFDVVAEGSRYLGGAICPGVLGSLEDLVRRTARLPGVEIRKPARVIGTDTEESMQSGIVFGSAGQIDGMVDRIWGELGGACPVIATGGLAAGVIPYCRSVREVDRHLTLKGLRALYDLNRGAP